MHFTEEYEAFNPIMRVLFEKRVHDFISRDNDTILAALQGGMRWHRKRKAGAKPRSDSCCSSTARSRPASCRGRCSRRTSSTTRGTRCPGVLYDTGRGYPGAVFAPGTRRSCTAGAARWPTPPLGELDAFEGDEYERVTVRCTDGTDALAYHWIAPLDGLRLLADGSWTARR